MLFTCEFNLVSVNSVASPKYALISAGRSDGFGAQYHAFMSIYAYCRYMNWYFLHNPIKSIAHNQSARLDQLTGLQSDDLAGSSEPYVLRALEHVEEVHSAKDPGIYYTPQVIKHLYSCHLKGRELCIPNYEPPASNYIAVHIRRGDVHSEMEQEKFRYLPDTAYTKIISSVIQPSFPSLPIYIFSQGENSQFYCYEQLGCKLMLNLELDYTFCSLVDARVLVMSRSSLSYSAALLSKGHIFYHPMWHSPMRHWNIAQ